MNKLLHCHKSSFLQQPNPQQPPEVKNRQHQNRQATNYCRAACDLHLVPQSISTSLSAPRVTMKMEVTGLKVICRNICCEYRMVPTPDASLQFSCSCFASPKPATIIKIIIIKKKKTKIFPSQYPPSLHDNQCSVTIAENLEEGGREAWGFYIFYISQNQTILSFYLHVHQQLTLESGISALKIL